MKIFYENGLFLFKRELKDNEVSSDIISDLKSLKSVCHQMTGQYTQSKSIEVTPETEDLVMKFANKYNLQIFSKSSSIVVSVTSNNLSLKNKINSSNAYPLTNFISKQLTEVVEDSRQHPNTIFTVTVLTKERLGVSTEAKYRYKDGILLLGKDRIG